MDRLLIVIASVLVFAGAVLGLRPLLLRLSQRDMRRQQAKPIPAHWLSLLSTSVPAARHLTESERTALLRASRELIETRHWEGCQGLVLSEDMQLAIAAHACLLTVALPGEPFPGLREILVYPRTFVPHRVCDPRKWLATSEPERPLPELGESWSNGIMVLSWEAALQGAMDPTDGHNVVLHESAHELAFEHDLTPTNLLLRGLLAGRGGEWRPRVANPADWSRTLEISYERICAKVEAHTPSVLHPYAATDLAEFFAVATEVFFERPQELNHEDPDLYGLLRTFYRQNPAVWAAA